MLKRLVLWLLLIGCSVSPALAASPERCSIDVINRASYNKILDYLLISDDDVRLYKKIFRSLADGDFKKADRLSADLNNHILMGQVLSEKYLHKKYPAAYGELKDWLEKYNDLPSASRIYNLAVRKGGSKGLAQPAAHHAAFISGWDDEDIKNRTPAEKQYLLDNVRKYRKAMRQGKTKAARLVLEQARFRKLAPDKYWDDMAASLALKYFVDGYDRLAWEWGTKASRRGTSGTGSWVAGLSAWRQQKYKNAAAYFSKLARSDNSDKWLVSAGAYWGARAWHKLGQNVKAEELLRLGARWKHTFYGILSAYKAGQPLSYNWDAVTYLNDFNNHDYIYDLLASPAIRRAVILIHAKRPDLAEKELRHGFKGMNRKQQEATIYIANQYQMHSLAIYACNNTFGSEDDRSYDGVAYPIPQWIPDSGWKVDKALLLALIRQESSFKPEAQSPAGARGLMQLMPNTAYHITRDARLKKDSSRLLQADYNLNLGQRYVDYLMAKPFIEGNLFYMTTAYNAGPGNLVKWQKKSRYDDDPLLFIEVLPSAETRIYIERVMANYWIYNMRFGLSNPTLQQVAEGKWPVLSRP